MKVRVWLIRSEGEQALWLHQAGVVAGKYEREKKGPDPALLFVKV